MNKILLLIAFLLTTQSAHAATLTKAPNNLGLVGYWSFNDCRGLKASDFSGYGNHGTLTAGPTWGTGRLGCGLQFDGTDDYVSLPTSPGYGISGDAMVTISAWFKTSTLASLQSIVFFGGSTTGGDAIAMFINNGGAGVVSAEFNGNNNCVTSTGAISADQWHHIVITKIPGAINTTSKIYINGAFVSCSGSGTTPSINIANPRVGIWWNGDYKFNGSIDEVRIYNRALGGNEVAKLYAAGQVKAAAPTASGLVGYWSFNDCRGLRASDFSGSGKHGTLTAGPTWGAGRLGCGLSFDGVDDYVAVSNFAMPSTGTLSYWVRSNTATWNEHGLPVSKRNDFIVHSWPGGKTISLFTAGIVSIGSFSVPGDLRAWHHHTWVLTGSNSYFYVDGVLVDSKVTTAVWGTSTNEMQFGYDGGHAGRFLGGAMDEVRIYNRALGAPEVKSLYESGVSLVNASQKTLLTSGLVGYWSFNGQDTGWSGATAGTTRDVSGQGNTGTMTNMSQNDSPVAGKSGQALAFDGVNDYVDTPSVSTYSFGTGDFTVGFWMKSTDTTGNMLSRGATTAAVGDWALVLFSGDLYWQSRHGVTNLYSRSATSILDGNWHYVVVKRTGTTNTMYFDNVQQGVSVTDTTDYSPTNILRIGDGANGFFGGAIDEVRIYNRALSTDEVKQLYYLGK